MIEVCHDMRIDPERAALAARDETQENEPVVVPGTCMGNTNLDDRLSGVILTGKKWDNSRTIKVALHPNVDATVRRKTAERVEQAFSYVNLDLRFVDSWTAGDIRIGFVRGDGSWSYLGTDNRTISSEQRTMNLGWLEPNTHDSEYERVVVHECFHMFGMPHEHQHPRNGIPWDKPKVYEYYMGPPNNWSREEVDHNLFRVYSETITQFSTFDKASIMLYPIPNEFTVGDWYAPRNTTPSKTDIDFLAEQYPKAVEPPRPTKPAITYWKLGRLKTVDKDYRLFRRGRHMGDVGPAE
jgi:serralysin